MHTTARTAAAHAGCFAVKGHKEDGEAGCAKAEVFPSQQRVVSIKHAEGPPAGALPAAVQALRRALQPHVFHAVPTHRPQHVPMTKSRRGGGTAWGDASHSRPRP